MEVYGEVLVSQRYFFSNYHDGYKLSDVVILAGSYWERTSDCGIFSVGKRGIGEDAMPCRIAKN